MNASTTTAADHPPAPPGAAGRRDDAAVIALVGLAHSISHFSQLLLAPLFPWIKDAFGVSYAQLGFLLTLFFVVSCVVQTLAGFWVDRWGPRPVLFAGLALVGVAALGYAGSSSYAVLAGWSVVAGIGNGVFHPVDYTLLNRRIDKRRIGHAYSVHGVTGSLGWALAPALLVPITLATSWRVALLCGALLAFAVLAVLLWQRARLWVPVPLPVSAAGSAGPQPEAALAFLRLPAVWACFGFFFVYAGALSIVQSFATQSARQLHAVPVALAAICLSTYMVCAAAGTLVGGFLVARPERCERVVATAFGLAAALALAMAFAPLPALAVPMVFGLIGLSSGLAGPSRDLLVKQSTPDHASGRVYGVVYAGLDIGQALVPLLVGLWMDQQRYALVWVGLAALQVLLIASAFTVRRARRSGVVRA